MEKYLQDQIIAVLRTILDPEVGINIWDFGLIYGVLVKKIRQDKQSSLESNLERQTAGKNLTNLSSLGNSIKLTAKLPSQDYSCHLMMTFTSFNCPAIETLPMEITQKVSQIITPENIAIEIVWEPRWDATLLSEEIQFELGLL